jgi:hypothetical protein
MERMFWVYYFNFGVGRNSPEASQTDASVPWDLFVILCSGVLA